jgi:hypothetical protein
VKGGGPAGLSGLGGSFEPGSLPAGCLCGMSFTLENLWDYATRLKPGSICVPPADPGFRLRLHPGHVISPSGLGVAGLCLAKPLGQGGFDSGAPSQVR